MPLVLLGMSILVVQATSRRGTRLLLTLAYYGMSFSLLYRKKNKKKNIKETLLVGFSSLKKIYKRKKRGLMRVLGEWEWV
jgi:hypothetical protein